MNLSIDERTLAVLEEIGEELAGRGVTVGKMFGLPCLKAESKVFAGAFGDAMAFKLPPEPGPRSAGESARCGTLGEVA